MPYSERVIFSAERNGMWYKYRKNQPKEVHCCIVFKIRIS